MPSARRSSISTHIEVRQATPRDVGAIAGHMQRHRAESGENGVHFMPLDPGDPAGPSGPGSKALAKPLTVPGWQRWWVAVGPNGRIVGHADLRGPPIRTELHRATFGVGLEKAYRHQGLGTSLALEAIGFARSASSVDWVDLGVFSNNAPALALYESLGFHRTGCVADRFRIGGQSIDDIQMTLPVGPFDAV